MGKTMLRCSLILLTLSRRIVANFKSLYLCLMSPTMYSASQRIFSLRLYDLSVLNPVLSELFLKLKPYKCKQQEHEYQGSK